MQISCNKCNNSKLNQQISSPESDYNERMIESDNNFNKKILLQHQQQKNLTKKSTTFNKTNDLNQTNYFDNTNDHSDASNLLLPSRKRFNNKITNLNNICSMIQEQHASNNNDTNIWNENNYVNTNNETDILNEIKEEANNNSIEEMPPLIPEISPVLQNKKRAKGFTAMQKYELEKLFINKKYISTEERIDLSKRLDLTQVQIKDWFKNHRKLMRRSLEQQELRKIRNVDAVEHQNDALEQIEADLQNNNN